MLSVLSYFTTYYGLAIMLDTPLAIVGSLGLQISMLGVAWELDAYEREQNGIY